MRLTTIDTGYFKLDGGAMFGVVPKVLWQKLEAPDANNLCTWAMRCLLIQTDDGRNILVDTGIGNKQNAKFFSHFYLHGDATLSNSLAKVGLTEADITDVLLTHLHFDHVGGALRYDEAGKIVPTFPNATYWSNQKHYDWAYTPNAREKASFLRENFAPLAEAGILKYVDAQPYDQLLDWLPNIQLGFVYGHTEAMMLPFITMGDKKILYCADLLPSPSHIGLPYVMGYDVRPLNTLEEKAWWLNKVVEEDIILYYEHAPQIEVSRAKRNAKGRIVAGETGSLADFLGA